jgi:predicted ATP-grasp superfamily ATP-dependent carboligase
MALKRTSSGALVLIGFAEAYAAIETAWSLRDAGYRVAAFTRAQKRPALRRVRGVDLFTISPPEESLEASMRDLRGLVGSLKPTALLPLDDASVRLASGAEGSAIVVGPTGEAVEYALDKRLQLEAAAAAGLRVPPTDVVEGSTPPAVDRYPVIVKPARALYEVDGALERPTGTVCANDAELAAAIRSSEHRPLLVQPFLSGIGEGLFGLVIDGSVGCWSAHRRIRMLNPQGSASSACASVDVDRALAERAEELLRSIGWSGLFMLEFLRDGEGTPWFMELNGRPWGSMALARRRGFEYPAWSVRAALDPEYAPPEPERPPAIVCRHLGMELVHLAFVARGPQSVGISSWPKLWPTLREMARISRRDRLYNWRRSEPDVLLADTSSFLRLYARRAAGGVR